MHRRFFVRPAGLLGFAGFAGMVGFAALRKPSSPAMAVEGGEGDGAADNSHGSTMYRMKASLGSFEWLRRDAKSPSMAKEEKEGERLRRFEVSKHQRENLPCLQKALDGIKAELSKREARLYEMKSRGFGNPRKEMKQSMLNEKFQTVQVSLVDPKSLQESLDAVVTEQMKTSPGSSHYDDLEQRIKKLEQQIGVCFVNHVRAFHELMVEIKDG